MHRVKTPPPLNECPGVKENGGTPLLPSLSDPLRPRVVASDRVLSMGQIELFD